MTEMLSIKSYRTTGLPAGGSTFANTMFAVVIVACLYLGREVLIPIALAVLMSFVLAPLVRFLTAWYVPRAVAVIFAALVAFGVVFSLGGLMVSQVTQLASDLPRYRTTLHEKIQSLRGASVGTGTLERASDVLKELGREIDKPNVNPKAGGSSPNKSASADKPIPVEVRQPDPGALQTLVALITPLIHPLATTGIVVIFVIFILLKQQDLRNRLVRLAGSGDLQRTTAAIDDAGARLSKLFLTQLILNASFGLVIGTGLWLIGIPSAPLWGMLAAILRFVPYVGALIAAIFPLVLAAAVGEGWSMVLWTLGLFLIVEPIIGHVIEPVAYGHSTGLSPVAVVASATFWTWLWGPIGLILATPLTICLVVLGRHVDSLKFLDVMLGDQPALTPEQLVYQRMLARDPIEAAEQAQKFLKDKPLVAYYDEVLVAGLRLAQADVERGKLDEESMLRIRDAVAEIVEDLSGQEDRFESVTPSDGEANGTPLALISKAEETLHATDREFPERWRTGTPVLCIPGLGLLDEAVALVITQLVQRQGFGARAEKADALSVARIFSLDTNGIALVCICYVEKATSAQIHYAVRRVRRKAPNAFILISLVGESNTLDDQSIESTANIDLVRNSLEDTIKRIRAVASGPVVESPASLFTPQVDPEVAKRLVS